MDPSIPTAPAKTPKFRTFKKNVKVGAGQHLGFTAGRGYYSAPGGIAHAAAAPAATPPDPYAPILAAIPKPSTPGQIQQQAQGEISPLVAAITGQVGRETQNASHAIAGYSNDAASKLAAINYGQPYQQGEQGQAAVDAALRASLAGGGQADADQLAQRLAVINDPTVAAAAGQVAANGAASGGTQVAQGSAALSNLLANAAAASSYGEKLPGIQRLAGLQQIAGVRQKGESDLATQVSQLEGQLPSIIQGLQATNESRSQQRTNALQNQLARTDAISATGATNANRLAVAQTSADARTASIEGQNARTAATIEGQNARTQAQIDAANYRAQLAAKKAGVKASGKGALTDQQLSKLVDTWKSGKAQSAHVAQTDKDGNVLRDTNGAVIYKTQTGIAGQMPFGQAYKRLIAFGVTDVKARQLLDTAYRRGEQGRAWVTNEEQAVLTRSRVPAKAHIVNGHGVLSPAQYQALKKANKLPPGQVTSEGAYVIAQVF